MIGICIKYYHENYGGMLQAYATTKILEKENIEYEIIRYKKNNNLLVKIKSIPRLFNHILMNDKYEALQKKISFKKNKEIAEKDKIRIKAFKDFNDTNFKSHLSKEYYGYKELCEGANNYDIIITGSDQLWSPAGLPTNFYNLMFVPDSIRKVSYASSFGVSYIPWYQKKRTKQYLERIDYISMRENSGKKIVKQLTGRDVPVVLDPVLLLTQSDWEKYIPNERMIQEKYIFAYFLGKNIKQREFVKKLANRTNLKVVTLRHLDQYIEYDENFGDYYPYNVSPKDFLNYLRNAEYVCTDSFHGAVFSIINRKKFVIFNRYENNSKHSKNSRIESLCSNLGIDNCRYSNSDDYMEQFINSSLEYEIINKKLKKLRETSEEYLRKALNIEEKND